ncbi:MAG: hypothetical protein UZ07_CHB004003238 [Chlorobi bacterium OLB7]|nr:MAG: hypothetical protein UZ07_CHB004003238 [Chlorobi bacterium OLB7]
MNKRAFAISGIILAAAVAGVLAFRPSVPDKPFSSEVWKEVAGDKTNNERLAMVNDLLDQGLLNGRSQRQVLQLLGAAEPESYFTSYGYQMMYTLGEGRGLLPGPNYLAIKFDDNDRVAGMDVMQD